MKYKVGDRVKVKSLDWYNKNKEKSGNVWTNDGRIPFGKNMSKWCNKVMTISDVRADHYTMIEDLVGYWTDEMIKGLAEEKTKPKFKKGDCVKCTDGSCGIIMACEWSNSLNCYQYFIDYIGALDYGYQDEKDLQLHTITTMNGKDIFESAKWKHEFECPEGYIFKDENGNIIKATKIVLEKKKKEYPKTYEECINELDTHKVVAAFAWEKEMKALQRLLVCRDAYWKIAGEEMGLGKPWKPDWNNISDKYCIYFVSGEAWSKECQTRQCPFAFPTPEMRDAFKKNFDPDIEFCKELL